MGVIILSVISSIYEKMNEDHCQLIDENSEHINNMLDYAISELVNIARENDIYLVDDGYLCATYEEIFHCLKHRSQKRKKYNQ